MDRCLGATCFVETAMLNRRGAALANRVQGKRFIREWRSNVGHRVLSWIVARLHYSFLARTSVHTRSRATISGLCQRVSLLLSSSRERCNERKRNQPFSVDIVAPKLLLLPLFSLIPSPIYPSLSLSLSIPFYTEKICTTRVLL